MKEIKQKYNIVGIGEILWDIYEDEKFLGGAPTNFAINCSQLGDHGIIVSRVGDDALGSELKNILSSKELTTEYIQTGPAKPTGTVRVSLDDQGRPSFVCTKDVAFDYLQLDDNLRQLAHSADGILFGTLAQRNPNSRETIQKFVRIPQNAFRLYDINLRGWDSEVEQIVLTSLKLADGIKLNDAEIEQLKSVWDSDTDNISFLRSLIKNFDLKIAALTLGADGCILLDAHNDVKLDGIETTVRDTTGCGDAFAAGMVHQYLRGKSLKEIALFSNQLGAFVAQFKGAAPVYRSKEFELFQSKCK